MYQNFNNVVSLAIYEWQEKIDCLKAFDIFDKFISYVGKNPDIATVVNKSLEGKYYRFRSFSQRNILLKEDWFSIGLLWQRQEDNVNNFSIECSFTPTRWRSLCFYIDTLAVKDVDGIISKLVADIAKIFKPIYGISYTMPYEWGARSFATGGLANTTVVEDLRMDADGFYDAQSIQFRSTFLLENRGLDAKFRDVFELNIISEGHLNAKIDRRTLKEWILEGGHGNLSEIALGSWLWRIPKSSVGYVREKVIGSGLTIVKLV